MCTPAGGVKKGVCVGDAGTEQAGAGVCLCVRERRGGEGGGARDRAGETQTKT